MIGHSCPFLEELPYIQTMYHKRTDLHGAALITTFCCTLALGWAAHTAVPAQTPEPSAAQQPALKPAPPPAAGGAASTTAGKPSEPAQEPPTEAERLIDQAIKKIAALKSVSADLVQSIVMLKQKFDIKGRFLKAPNSRTYLRLTVSGLPDSDGTMLQICDGETLWDYQKILESELFRKLSIKPVLERLNSPDMDATTRDQILNQMGFAGPDVLLVGLRKAVRFDQKEEDTLDGKPMWILRGTWRNRNGLVGPDQRPLPATGPLPAFVPSLATLYLGKDDGWPYRLDLLGKVPTILQDTRRVGPDGKPLGSRGSMEKVDASEIRLVYSNVLLNATIRPDEFAFQAPPNATVEDNTEILIKGLDQAIQVQVMKKRAEAARQEGPVLDQSIDIPKPPADPTPK
jgi:outer membrane lipoprotein-sorting protein